MIPLTLANIVSAAYSATKRAVQLTLDMDDGDNPDEQEVFAHAPLMYVPQAEDSRGRCEGIVWRKGNESITIATHDRRFAVTMSAGEVVLTNMPSAGGTQVTVKMTAAGVCEVTRDGAGVQKVLTVNEFNSWISNTFDLHAHATAGTGAPSPPSPIPPDVVPKTGTSLNGSPALKTESG